jgi:saccharopine dehydrogenase-like NADP-dependent oxidoreductase
LSVPKNIVVIGGTGHFGGRICRRLLGEPNTELVVTSRTVARAEALVAELRQNESAAALSPAALDQSSPDFEKDLTNLEPDIVIHTAGPYQGQSYRVARACIEVGSHYIDLADSREFVAGFSCLHEEAQRRGVLLVSGASTLPGLSSAVVDYLEGRFDAIHAIEISIAPAHRTPRGAGTAKAVLSYCGRPFAVLEQGSWVTRYGWQDLKKVRYPALGARFGGACDVPDLALLPEYVPTAKTVTFHAALEAKWEQITLWKMGWMTRLRIVQNWDRFVPTFQWASERLIRFGSDRGGMQMRLSGVATDQSAKTVIWNLTARQNHGPEIPCTPALILARKLVTGDVTERGAMPCLGMISLADFDAEVRDLDIEWTVEEESDA